MLKRMKRIGPVAAVIAALICTLGLRAYVQARSHVVHTTFYSNALHQTMKVDIYLPPHYQQDQRYPALYLLHGKDGNANSWMSAPGSLNAINVNLDATRMIESHQIRPLIIVSPEIDNGYGIDTAKQTIQTGGYSRGQYATYITDDLVHFIDSHYSTVHRASGRYIGGFSMGGFAALHVAFTNPHEYSKVGVMSAALWNGGLPESLAWIYPTMTLQRQRDPITIAEHTRIRMPVKVIEGTSDPFYAADLTLAHVLKGQGADVSLHTYPGGHNYVFWRSHASELLLFFDGVNR